MTLAANTNEGIRQRHRYGPRRAAGAGATQRHAHRSDRRSTVARPAPAHGLLRRWRPLRLGRGRGHRRRRRRRLRLVHALLLKVSLAALARPTAGPRRAHASRTRRVYPSASAIRAAISPVRTKDLRLARKAASSPTGRSGSPWAACPAASAGRWWRGGIGRPAGGRRRPRRRARGAVAPTTGPCPRFQRLVAPGMRVPLASAWPMPAHSAHSPTGGRPSRSRAAARAPSASAARRSHENDDVMPTWCRLPASSYRPSSSEPTCVPGPFLCQRKPATTQSAVRACLILSIARLPGW